MYYLNGLLLALLKIAFSPFRGPFKAKRSIFTYTETVPAPPDEIFPLLCHTREYEWLVGWKRDLIYSESGYVENNAIFKTKLDVGETWVTTRYEPALYILEAVIFNRANMVVKFEIRLHDNGDGTSKITWHQTHTGLGALGNFFTNAYDQTRFERSTKRIMENLKYYLRTGEKQSFGNSGK